MENPWLDPESCKCADRKKETEEVEVDETAQQFSSRRFMQRAPQTGETPEELEGGRAPSGGRVPGGGRLPGGLRPGFPGGIRIPLPVW